MEKIINPGIHSGFPYLGISIFQGSSIRVAVIRQLRTRRRSRIKANHKRFSVKAQKKETIRFNFIIAFADRVDFKLPLMLID
ncbi:hypothetical protein NC652_020635 [Populus alba x Populus x berolinensis]|nr:hypothetical protein NC652_020635 [Populus alba x Populus x berolinensis]